MHTPPPPATSAVTPVEQASRIQSIDVLRGIALLGILLMNIPEFSMPSRYSEPFRTDTGNVNFWVRAVITVFFEGKMRALFCMVFGAGILLFIVNKKASYKKIAGLFYRRMTWLVLFGLVDAHLLLWTGDILYYYGLIGMIAFLFAKLKPWLLILGIPLVAIVEFASGNIFYQDIRGKRIEYVAANKALSNGQTLDSTQKQALDNWRQIELSFIPNDDDIKEKTKIMKSGYSAVAQKIRKETFDYQTKYLLYGLWDPLALMLLGMALYKWGFFSNQWSRRKYQRMALIGYGLGLPLVLFDFYYGFVHFPTLAASLELMERTPVQWINLIYPVQRILLVLAHTSVIMLLLRSAQNMRWAERLASVGQMALTNYIMQSVICTLFFFGYGLNFYAELEYYQIFYVVIGVWILQLIISPVWLRRYWFGPLEWVWRTLTYWGKQPFRKK
jgi:uncharacterized protein